MFRKVPVYCFGKYKFNANIINKVSTLLKIKPSLANEDINFFGDVRLLDSQNKLIGVFACEEARKKADKLGQDLIMINQEIKPALCKVCDYSDELASKFMNDIVKIKEQQKLNDQHFKLSHTITMQDLKLKVNQAKDLIKKQNTLRVTIICPIETAIQAKSILYTLKDLSQSFMIPLGDIKTKDYKEKEQFDKKKEEQVQVQLDIEFESIERNELQSDLAQIKIERLINQYYSRSLQEKTEDEQDLADLFKVQQTEKDKKVDTQENKKSKLEEMMDDDGFDFQLQDVSTNTQSCYLRDGNLSKYVKLFKMIEWSQGRK
ncbi:unnamed protein product (macronuclear) [Paramecium tetraurelia]|uniref:Translation initiation factor 3 N-terminal domain-containing protein n=1 Tax=Paramecium tetraurelia TaxID=5888 RepID=A0C5E0_PARTE|nr:uncharacterized protein GSPATT00006506001 [Paramecium tetraurelia]CAK66007.1 unnamed protein product [Paramecium tetraurelia]|eukprot:XP_001433404.1 hypothetical protein (macronuclear) [Paramecium tetraurelia strain d4-2]